MDFNFSLFGGHWVMPKSFVDLLDGCRNWFVKHSSFVWNLALCACCEYCERKESSYIWRCGSLGYSTDVVFFKIIVWMVMLGFWNNYPVVYFIDFYFSLVIAFILCNFLGLNHVYVYNVVIFWCSTENVKGLDFVLAKHKRLNS